ncbi:MAG TPA: DUF1634 domain-containing protein [Pirellulales bacterium]|nr:DUF1634 domain-containing protein [Pirellulales bacterium]
MRNTDPHRLDHWVHRTLLVGLTVSGVLLAVGLTTMLAQGHEHAPQYESFPTLLRDAARLRGSAVTTLGLLALMMTPILRVVVLLAGWAVERDWRFAGVALAVFVLLCVSLTLGAH